jgi:hypothetical protein
LKPEDLKVVWVAPNITSSIMDPQLKVAPEFEGKVTLKSIKVPEVKIKDAMERRY